MRTLGVLVSLVIAACGDDGHGVPAVCEELAERCHHLDDDMGLGQECHEIGHAGVQATCEARSAECLAYCDAPDAGSGPGPDAMPTLPDAGFTVQEMPFDMPAGRIVEAELSLAAGGRVVMSYQAGGALEWNLHTHDAGGTQTIAEGTSAADGYTLVSDQAASYWFMWRNPPASATTDLDVRLELYDGATFVSWQ